MLTCYLRNCTCYYTLQAVKKYGYGDRKISVAEVKKFEDEFAAGTLAVTLKSEEPTDADLAEPVKVRFVILCCAILHTACVGAHARAAR
jgi:hypothetical protein